MTALIIRVSVPWAHRPGRQGVVVELTHGDEVVQRRMRHRIEVPAQDHVALLASAAAGLDHGVDLRQHDRQLGQLDVSPPGVEQ